LHVRVLALDGGLDPDDYIKQNGAEAYQARLDAASGYFHWLADRARGKFDMRSAEGRMDAFKFLLPAVQRISDKIERAAVANDLAGYLGVDPGLVLDQFKKAAADRRAPAPQAAPRPEIPALERILLKALLNSEEARAQVLPRLTPVMTGSFATSEIFDALRQITEIGGAVTFSALEGRLKAASRALLHELMAADEMCDEAASLDQAQACLRRMEGDIKRRQMDELRSKVKTAEREGRIEDALASMAELSRLEKEAKAASGS
jgi:DNA primase